MPTKQSLNLWNKQINIRIQNTYRLKTKLWERNVFTPVCDSVHREGVSARGSVHPSRQTLPFPPGQTTPQTDTPWAYTPKTGTEAGSTYPTGMHSCLPSNGLFTMPDTETEIHTNNDTIDWTHTSSCPITTRHVVYLNHTHFIPALSKTCEAFFACWAMVS